MAFKFSWENVGAGVRRRISSPNFTGLLQPLPAALSFLFLSLLMGCQSSHQTTAGASTAFKSGTPSESGARDQRVLFSAVYPTNQVRREWLAPPTNFFRLGPGDAVEIEMLGEPGSPATASVGPDGKIYYSLLNGTFVWGLTLSEARDLLENNLAKYLRVKPEVALTLRTNSSNRVWILGSVQRPGVYALSAPLTVLEAIAEAGGAGRPTVGLAQLVPASLTSGGSETSPSAGAQFFLSSGSPDEIIDLENSFVIRDGKLLPIDFSRLLRRGDLSQNIYLRPDDFVYLRPAISKGDIYVLGAVAAPNIVEYREHISLLGAIASVGGPVQYAYRSHVAILRGSVTHPTIATFDYNEITHGRALDVPLEPGDIVYVPFSPFRFVEQFADQILNQFVSTIAINEGRNAIIRSSQPIGVSIPFGK